jgi:hypothetical protein
VQQIMAELIEAVSEKDKTVVITKLATQWNKMDSSVAFNADGTGRQR